MRRLITLLLVGMAALSLPAVARAAGTLYVSNLGPNSSPSPLNDLWQYGIDTDGTLFPLDPLSVPNDGLATSVRVSPDERSAYVVAGGGVILQYDIEPETGALVEKDLLVDRDFRPWDLAFAPDGKSAYFVNVGSPAAVSQFDVDPLSGTLAPKNPPTVAPGSGSSRITVSPDGRSAYVANSGCTATGATCAEGALQYDVDPVDGTLSPKSPPAVATGDFPLDVAVTPGGKHAYVTATGGIFHYDVDPQSGTLSPTQVTAAGQGVRVAISPDGKSL